MFTNILVGVRPSDVDECAVDAAISLAQRYEAKLHLVYVAGAVEGWGNLERHAASGETEGVENRIREQYAEKLLGLDEYEVKVVVGVPHAELLRTARKVHADLIVMGPRDEEDAERRAKVWGMKGSTFERVSQKARCPVMIVTESSPYGENALANIVVATDFSKRANYAVAYAAKMVEGNRDKVTILHVVNTEKLSAEFTPGAIEGLRLEAEQRLNSQYGELMEDCPNCSLRAVAGNPAECITEVAKEVNADIILAAHHSSEVDPEEAFVGSTLAKVAFISDTPILSINHPTGKLDKARRQSVGA